ncbi:hypothetical protein KC338_g252 [Hortaea werneckii]|nr:hypothetical protein KC338_g252 [Hortaea werneckii]
MRREVSAVVDAGPTIGKVLGEILYCAENTPDEDQRGGAVQHDADPLDVRRKVACAPRPVVDDGHKGGEGYFNAALQDERDADKDPADGVLRTSRYTTCKLTSPDTRERLDHDADKDKYAKDPARVEDGVHGEVMHQAAQNVVFGSGVDGRPGEDEDDLGDVEANILLLV